MGACIGCRKRKLKGVDAESKLDLLESKRNRDNYFHDPKNVEISTFADKSSSNCTDSSLRNNTITDDENCLLLRDENTVINNVISQLQGSAVADELKMQDENDRKTHVESKSLEACHLNNHEDDDESGYYEGNGDSPQRVCGGGITCFEDDENYDDNWSTIAADCRHFTTSSLLFDRNLLSEECITKKMSLRGTNSGCQDIIYLNRLLPSDFLLPVMVFDKQKVKYNQFELNDFYQMLLVSSGRSSIPTINENKLIWKSATCKFDRFSISMKDNRQSFWFRDSSSTVVSALVLHQQFIDFIIAKFTLEIVNNLLTENSHSEDVNHVIQLLMNIKFIRRDYHVKPSLLAVYQMHNEACESIQLVTVNYTNIKRIHTTSISFIVPLDEWPKGYCDEFFQRQRKWPNAYDINMLRIHCAAVQPTHQNRWIFYFGLCENLLVSMMSKTHKSFFQYVMATFTNQSQSEIVINKVTYFPAVILTHMLLRYFEQSDNICYQQFVPWFRQLFERSALLHYFDSSINFQQESSLEQWIDIKQRIGYLYNRKNIRLQTRMIGNNATVLTSERKFKLMYITEFSLELKRRIVSGNLIRIDPGVIKSINDELRRKGNFLACRKKIHEDIFFNEIEHSASIVQAYINQIRAEYVPILYHCLWSSYIHYAYPFILQVIEKPIF